MWIDIGRVPAAVREEYDRASMEAVRKLIPRLSFPSDHHWLAWMKAAMNRHNNEEQQWTTE